MRTAAKVLALALLLAIKPACGGGGGGGGSSSPGVSFPALPSLVSPIPPAGSTGGLPLLSTGAPTINVNGMSDAAAQAALQAALNVGGTIVMTNGGGSRTIVLSGILNMPSDSGTPKTVILDGTGQITLSGNHSTGILQINDEAQLTVQQMTFIDARATASGGAINGLARARLVTIINCSFDNCQTTQGGPDIGGGAIRIANGQHTEISGCTFNKCAGSNGGAVNSLGTQLTILNSTFTQNAAFGSGGGADAGPTGQGGIGGAVYVDNVSNAASLSHQLTLTGCVFNANVANDSAGALFGFMTEGTGSSTPINQCTFAGNAVVGGHGYSGAIYSQSDTLTVSNSTFNLNSATSSGGAVFCTNDTSTFTNCTFQGNTCAALGGGIFTTAGNVTLLNVTLAQNVGGNFAGGLFSTATTTTVQNCVFSGNTALGNAFAGDQVNSSFAGGGANVQAPNTGTGAKPATATGTTLVADAKLGPLQNNGGPTFTMQPQAGSAAIDLTGVTGAPATDQRGNVRTGAGPDAGACESP
ncbi:MAG TPA: choice-of-anchor Q domain-containing protein [Planctomycetota bacterium]|nr:choice-of-anchor Q domain-containing protein [Planctomycetota bacterium]